MTKEEVLRFIKKHHLAVIATVSPDNRPQAAVVEYGELNDLTIVVDMFKTSRKYKNLQRNNKAALVIGWNNNVTVQIDGVAQKLDGEELKRPKRPISLKTHGPKNGPTIRI